MNERTDPQPLPTARRPLLRRAPKAAAGLAAIAAVLATGSGLGGAAAVDPTNPTASAHTQCSGGSGGEVVITYANLGGISNAVFTTTVDGVAQPDVTVVPGGTQMKFVTVAEGSTPHVVVTSGAFAYDTVLGLVDCYQAEGTLAVVCLDDGTPQLVVDENNTGSVPTTFRLVLDGTAVNDWLGAHQTNHRVETLVEDAPFDATLSADDVGLLAELHTASDCTQPVPDPVPQAGVESVAVAAPAAVPAPAPVVAAAPHFTG